MLKYQIAEVMMLGTVNGDTGVDVPVDVNGLDSEMLTEPLSMPVMLFDVGRAPPEVPKLPEIVAEDPLMSIVSVGLAGIDKLADEFNWELAMLRKVPERMLLGVATTSGYELTERATEYASWRTNRPDVCAAKSILDTSPIVLPPVC